MKKVFAIMLALVMGLSLCACGENSNHARKKYIGTYIGNSGTFAYKSQEELTLQADGTGFFESHVTNIDYGSICEAHDFYILAPLESYDVTWEVDDNGYITIHFQGKKYYKRGDLDYYYIEDGIAESFTSVYEMKGAQLFYVDSGNSWLTKTSS